MEGVDEIKLRRSMQTMHAWIADESMISIFASVPDGFRTRSGSRRRRQWGRGEAASAAVFWDEPCIYMVSDTVLEALVQRAAPGTKRTLVWAIHMCVQLTIYRMWAGVHQLAACIIAIACSVALCTKQRRGAWRSSKCPTAGRPVWHNLQT